MYLFTSLLVIPDNGTTNGMFNLLGTLLVCGSSQWKVPFYRSHISSIRIVPNLPRLDHSFSCRQSHLNSGIPVPQMSSFELSMMILSPVFSNALSRAGCCSNLALMPLLQRASIESIQLWWL